MCSPLGGFIDGSLGNTTVENKVVQVLKGISQKENCSESTPLFFGL